MAVCAACAASDTFVPRNYTNLVCVTTQRTVTTLAALVIIRRVPSCWDRLFGILSCNKKGVVSRSGTVRASQLLSLLYIFYKAVPCRQLVASFLYKQRFADVAALSLPNLTTQPLSW